MPERDAERPDAIEQVIAQIGLDNLETILASYRRFAAKVDHRALLDWSIKQPLDDLLQPLFLAALVTITRDLELGDVGRLLAQMQDGETQWAVRMDGPHGLRISPAADEHDARRYASGPAEDGRTHTVVRRRIGPWTEAPSEDR